MDEKLRKKLVEVLNNTDCSSEDFSTVENSPLSSPIKITSKELGKRHRTNITSLQPQLPYVSNYEEIRSESPVPPMSPETTKLFNILARSNVFDDDDVNATTAGNAVHSIAGTDSPNLSLCNDPLLVHETKFGAENIYDSSIARPTSADTHTMSVDVHDSGSFLIPKDTLTSNLKLECKDVCVPTNECVQSLPVPVHTSELILPDAEIGGGNNKQHDILMTDDCKIPDEIINENDSTNLSSPSILPEVIAANDQHDTPSDCVETFACTPELHAASTGSPIETNFGAIRYTSSTPVQIDPYSRRDLPSESSIEAPAYSPLTPRIVRPYMGRDLPGESSVEAPAYSPLTPRPIRRMQSYEHIIPTATSSPLDSTVDLNDDSVEDPNYEGSDANNDSCEPLSVLQEVPENIPEGRPRKGRKRKYGEFNRAERKIRKYKNLPYVNYKKQNVDQKTFIDHQCKCSKKCNEVISADKRRIEFDKFYALGSYIAQNMFIVACVKEEPVKRSYITKTKNIKGIDKKKTYSRQYYLQNELVCREMFVKTLQTTPKRINTALCQKRSDNIQDRRGVHGGHNKVAPESELFFTNLVNKLPRYVSHYCRNERSDNFLKPDMTFSKIYQQYCNESYEAHVPLMSLSKAKQIFYTKFNLRTKPLKKDTCNKCDTFENKKKGCTAEELEIIQEEHKRHVLSAKTLRDRMNSDIQLAKSDATIETITFDLEKTLPLPRIPTNIIFYKRQLWVYNLGVHTGSDDQAHCYVWVEGEAGRGSQEVGSCLLYHISKLLKNNVKHLILWSDSCGGQNRNIKITLMLKAILQDHPTLKSITMRFLESGHSFLPNGTDFGKIESALKHQQRLYTAEDYINIMKACKKQRPMKVYKMKTGDFFSSTKLEKAITNRKKSVDGRKISWLLTKEILIKKGDMFTIFMRQNLSDDHLEVDLKRNVRRRTEHVLAKHKMELLWPEGKPIPEAKLKDIESILHLIPQDDQPFYAKLKACTDIADDVDGFSGQPDFEIENEENCD